MSNQDPYRGGGSSSTGGAGGRLPWSDIVGISSSEAEYQSTHDGGGSSSAGDIGSHNSWGNVVGLQRSEYGHQPMYPVATSMADPGTSYHGRGFTATGSAGGQPPYNLGGAADPNYMARRRPTYSAGTSMSYPGASSYGHSFTTPAGIGEQRPHNIPTPAYIGMYEAGNTNTLLQTGMVPRSGVDPQSGYNHQHPPQPLDNLKIRPSEPNSPQAEQRHGSWRPDENNKFIAMLNSGASWPDISKQMRRTIKMCQQHKRHLDQKENARAAAQARFNQEGGESYVGPAAGGATDVPSFRRTNSSHIDWSDGELIAWARGRAREISIAQGEQRLGQVALWEMVAQELNAKNGTHITGRTLQISVGL